MADPKAAEKLKTAVSSEIDTDHVIEVRMEDLLTEEQEAIELEVQLAAEKARKKRLACYQKTRNGVVKKANDAGAGQGRSYIHPRAAAAPTRLEDLLMFLCSVSMVRI